MGVLDRLRPIVDRIPVFSNEETRVARFMTIPGSERGFTIPDPNAPLPVNDLHIEDIDAPGLLAGSVSVIYYRTSHTGHPSFSVRLNETRLTSQNLSGDGPLSWHEIVPSNALLAEDNLLTLAVSGDGAVTFSDIVILYQSNKTTIKVPPVLDPGVATT